MKLNEIPDVLQSKLRLAIIAGLLDGEKSFNEIKEITQGTDGNLSVNFSKLEAEGYITIKKEFRGKKPLTTYTLTEYGFTIFKEYVDLLAAVINSAD